MNKYQSDGAEDGDVQPLERPDPAVMGAHIKAFKAWKDERDQAKVQVSLDDLARAATATPEGRETNVFGMLVEAAMAGATHGEICHTLRRELGFGNPLVMA